MKKRDSKGGWLLYLMVHVPFIWFFKIGITSAEIGAAKRAKQVDRAVFGFPLPIMVLFLPGAYHIEQDLHRRFSFCHARFYRGDGHQEWFFMFPIVLWPVMVAVWLSYIYAVDLVLGTAFFETIIIFLFNVFRWFFHL